MIKTTQTGRYQARVYHRGRQIAMSTFDRKKDAAAWEAEQKRSLALGSWVDPKAGDVSLSDLIAQFNEVRRGAVGQHTWDTDETNLRLHVPADVARLPIRSIKKDWLARLFAAMLRTHARGTVSRFRNSLSSVYAYAVERDIIARNLVVEVKLPRGVGAPVETICPFAPPDFDLTLVAQIARSPEYAEVVEFMRHTGLRWGEVVALRVGDCLKVPFFALLVARSESDGYDEKVTKSRKSRRVPLMGRASEIVRGRIAGRKPTDRMFTSPRGSKLNGGNFKRALAWEKTAAGYRVHDLRHTCATNWLQADVDVKTVSEWLGHSDTSVTLRIYVHHMGSDSDLAAIRRVEAASTATTGAEITAIDSKRANP